MVNRLLILTGNYPPAYKAGGPIQSLKALTKELQGKAEIYVICKDRDHCEVAPLENITPNAWQLYEGANVYYATPKTLHPLKMLRLIRHVKPDIVYMQSLFNPLFTITPLMLRWLKLISKSYMVLAVRGELSTGDISRTWHKRLYLWFFKTIRLYRVISQLHVTSPLEEEAVNARFEEIGIPKERTHISHVNDIKHFDIPTSSPPEKEKGAVRFVYIGRIAEVKNIYYVLERLSPLSGTIMVDIYGPMIEPHYWRTCEKAMHALPDNIEVNYKGALDNQLITETLQRYHFFLCPSVSENFGHAILEALACGVPAFIGDKTPFSLTEKKAGWSLPHADKKGWEDALQEAVDMDDKTYKKYIAHAKSYAEPHLKNTSLVKDYEALLKL